MSHIEWKKPDASSIVCYVIMAVLTLVFLSVMCYPNSEHNWVVQSRNNRTIKRLEGEIKMHQARTEQNRERLQQLQSDRNQLEKFARERYHLAGANEDVYVVDHE